MITLKDIALKCGVSQASVSRVLKNDVTLQISNEKRNNIINTAMKMEYKPKGNTNTGIKIAVINWYSHDQELIDPYYYYIRKSVEVKCEKFGFNVSTFFKDDNVNKMDRFDGIIAIGKFSKMQAKEFTKLSNNIVFIDSNPDNNLYSSIEVDFEKIMKDVFDFISTLNVKTIGMITGVEKVDNKEYEDLRLKYFEQFMNGKKLEPNKYLLKGEFTIESGFKLFEQMHKEDNVPDIIICGNDLIAIGVNKAAYNYGYQVGVNLQIIGINNIPLAKYMVPSLTTVNILLEDMGIEAVNLLKNKLDNPGSVEKTILLPATIKIRKSTIISI